MNSKVKNFQFQPVIATGRYLNQFSILVQNKFNHDQRGWEVLTPLQIDGDDRLLLVDRGWISAGNYQKASDIEIQKNELAVSGYIKFLNEYQFILGDNVLNPKVTPLIVQKIDINEISRIMHQTFYPFVLRLDASEPHGFVRDWPIATALPERHLGYAIQWLALAIVLFISYLCFSCERVKVKTNEK